MKKSILTALVASAAVGAFAQGTVVFSNLTGLSPGQPIFNTDGTTKLTSAYEGQVYESATAGGTFTAVGNIVSVTGTTGYILGGSEVLAGVAGGANVFIEIRAWKTSEGSSYEAALANPNETGTGVSIPVAYSTGNPGGSPPTAAGPLTGFKSFQLVIPEPSTIALGALGLGALLIRRRK